MAEQNPPDYNSGAEPTAAPKDTRDLALKWRQRIRQAQKYFERDYFPRAQKIVSRYRDERGDMASNSNRKFNLLWSNVQTLGPAIYAKDPEIEVSRRFQDADPVARVACLVLERAVSYESEMGDFGDSMLDSRLDYLLVARAVLWQRYEPEIESYQEDDPLTGEPAVDEDGNPIMREEMVGETAPCEYVYWKDFLHNPCKQWREVTWVARRVLMARDKAKKRFPDTYGQMKFIHKTLNDDDRATNYQKDASSSEDNALVWEIWDITTRSVYWMSPDVEDALLDHKPDPLRLRKFFPCPKPLYATLTTDKLVPIPDYIQYQDQAIEIDNLTQRISLLQKALSVRGAYDSSNPALARILEERPENFLVPVNNWAAFAEKGGLKNAISFVPIEIVAQVLEKLVQQRQLMLQDVYQISGISDIVRGESKPRETATAQRIKGNFATIRLDDRKSDIAKFARDALRLRAEVICEHFDQKTIREMSGFDYMHEVVMLKEQEEQQKQQLAQQQQMQAQQAMQGGMQQPQQPMQPPQPEPPSMVENLWQQVYQLLKDDRMRHFRLDIETDSTVEIDRQMDQEARIQFVTASSQFLEKGLAAMQMQPAIGPVVGQMLLFAARGFPIGRELEAEFESFIQMMRQQAANPQPQGDPEAEAKIKAIEKETELKDKEMQHQIARDDKKAEADFAREEKKGQMDLQIHAQKAQQDMQMNQVTQQMKLKQMMMQQQQMQQQTAMRGQQQNQQHQLKMQQMAMQPAGPRNI